MRAVPVRLVPRVHQRFDGVQSFGKSMLAIASLSRHALEQRQNERRMKHLFVEVCDT